MPLRRTAKSLTELIAQHRTLTVLSGAGCSTASGIPDYRDDEGAWKHARPVMLSDFVSSAAVRRRYWARSYLGWPRIAAARPNQAHRALATLERHGYVAQLITQNVDELHDRAGSQRVINLHGVLSRVRCLSCRWIIPRQALQGELSELNPHWTAVARGDKPDGDVELPRDEADAFRVPACARCAGLLKPDVVFFGENVPRQRVAEGIERLTRSHALLVVGSSLMVYSGFRFVRLAHEAGIPIIIVNRGKTRADDLALERFNDDCGTVLASTALELAA